MISSDNSSYVHIAPLIIACSIVHQEVNIRMVFAMIYKIIIFAKIDTMKLIQRHISQIIALCEKHKVTSLYVFGSVLTDSFNNESDVDFVVIFDKAKVEDYFDNYFDFKYALQDLLGREVDLVEDQTIRNKYLRQNVDASKQLIYG